MIGEFLVLLRVQHLQQCRSRIPLKVRADLIDFVEQEDRIILARVFDRGNDSSRNRANVGSSVSADLCFIAHAAQRHADKLSARRASDGFRDRGLADTRRSYQTNNRTFDRLIEVHNGQIFENTLLDLFKSIVILVENAFRLFEVSIGLGGFVPRQFQNCLHVIADDAAVCGARRHFSKFSDFTFYLFLNLRIELQLLKLLTPALRLACGFFSVAEFVLNHLHLLSQDIFFLILFHRFLHTLADVTLHGKNLILLQNLAVDDLQTLFHVEGLQHLLLGSNLNVQLHRHRIREDIRLLDRADQLINLILDRRVQFHVFIEGIEYRAHHCLHFYLLRICRRNFRLRKLCHDIWLLRRDAAHHRAILAFYQHPHCVTLDFEHLLDLYNRSDLVIILRRRNQDVFILLRSQK